MRDIRTDLKERLTAAETKRAQLRAELGSLDAEVSAVMSLMEIEDQRTTEGNGQPRKRPLPPLEEFITNQVRARASTKADLKVAAQTAGYDVNGRNIHGHLLKLVRNGAVKKMGDDTYVSSATP